MPPYFMRSGGMCCSCFLCVSAVCFFLKIPLCFLPLKPPGVRHFTMEPSWKSIFFSLHISYHILTANIPLRVEKFSSGWLGGTQLFHFRYSATHGEQFAHERRTAPGDGAVKLLCWIPLFFEYLFADSPKTLCWFPALLQPKSTILSHFQVFFREATGYKPMQVESCHHFQADRRIYP